MTSRGQVRSNQTPGRVIDPAPQFNGRNTTGYAGFQPASRRAGLTRVLIYLPDLNAGSLDQAQFA